MTPSPDVRYPVGRFDFKEPYRSEDRPFSLLSPWKEPYSRDGLVRQSQLELAPGHELY